MLFVTYSIKLDVDNYAFGSNNAPSPTEFG